VWVGWLFWWFVFFGWGGGGGAEVRNIEKELGTLLEEKLTFGKKR